MNNDRKSNISKSLKGMSPAALKLENQYLRGDELAKGLSLDILNSIASARALTAPEALAACTIQKYEGDTLNVNAVVDELRDQVAEVAAGNLKRPEAMLVAQAHTLGTLFNYLARYAHSQLVAGNGEATDRYLRLALRAQSQAVRTIEALNELKNPRPVAFVQQANIANGPQQVNNVPASSPRAGENEIPPSKLLEVTHGQRLDTGTQGAASGVNQDLETVGAIHRANE